MSNKLITTLLASDAGLAALILRVPVGLVLGVATAWKVLVSGWPVLAWNPVI